MLAVFLFDNRGDKFLIGYAEGVTNVEIENLIRFGLTNKLPDVVGEIIKERSIDSK